MITRAGVAVLSGEKVRKRHPSDAAARFHLVCLASVIAGTAFTLTMCRPNTRLHGLPVLSPPAWRR
jgi:hypothetical protein